tara:strand:+ start:165 stop:341 length:177 start_codon:yes stop_codon:yes gene_type:complete
MSDMDTILDTELQKEIVALEAEMLQANIDCQNALNELSEITEKEIKQSVHEFMEKDNG